MIPTTQSDIDRVFRLVNNFRIVELKEVLNVYGFGSAKNGNKAQLQNRILELLRSSKKLEVAQLITTISNRLKGIAGHSSGYQRNDMVRGNSSASSYGRYQSNQATFGRPASNFNIPPAFTPPTNFNSDASKVRFVPLPFYDIKEQLLAPIPLISPYRNEGVNASVRYTFTIPREYIGKLSLRDTDPLPRYEIQMRMALCETNSEQPDAFPNSVRVSVNNSPVSLPPILNTQPQPGQPRPEQQKRQSRPVNITPSCNPIREQPYQLAIDWQPDRHVFIVGIWIVHHVNSIILRDRLATLGPKYYEETRALIKSNLGGHSEDDISMDTLKISLMCPLSRTKMVTPVRPMTCTHLQCFDLHNYIMMNERRPTWRCPVCNKSSPYNVLVVDEYFAEIIRKAGEGTKEVELLTDGGWKIVDEKTNSSKKTLVNGLDGGVSAPASVSKPDSVGSSSGVVELPTTSAPASAKPPQSAPDIITLSDDSDLEDDDFYERDPKSEDNSDKSTPVPPSQMENRKRPHDHISSTPNNNNTDKRQEVITLESDSDTESNHEPPVASATGTPIETIDNLVGGPSSVTTGIKVVSERSDVSSYSDFSETAIAEISLALATFLNKLEDDNANCVV